MRNKKLSAIKNLMITLSLCALFILSSSCTNRTTKDPSYDYYYFQSQSIFRYHSRDEKHSLLLSIPTAYHIEKMKISPLQQYIAFTATHEGKTVLFLCDMDGSNMRRLIEGDSLRFDWSPTEDKLGIIQQQDRANFFYLTPHEIDTAVLIAEADAFQWSPHGKYLSLERKNLSSADYSIIHHDGTGLRHIHRGEFLSWSDDGQHLFFTETTLHNLVFKAYHYSGTLTSERLFSINADIKLRNSAYEKKTLISYVSDGSRLLEWYDPRKNQWDLHEDMMVQDYIRSHDPDSFWELWLSTSEGLQELYFNSDEGLQLITQSEQVHILSLSPNESRMICLSQNGSQKLLYAVNTSEKTWEFIGSGENIREIIWHPDSSRVAINLDQRLLLVSFKYNMMVTITESSLFLNWKYIAE